MNAWQHGESTCRNRRVQCGQTWCIPKAIPPGGWAKDGLFEQGDEQDLFLWLFGSLPTPGIGLYTDEWQRIFTYSTLSDRVFLVLAALAEVGTGVTLPLLNIIFGKSLLVQVSTSASLMFLGRLVGSFSTYTDPNSPDAKAKFFHNLNQLTLVVPWPQFLNYFQQFAFGKCVVPFLATNSSLKIFLLAFHHID